MEAILFFGIRMCPLVCSAVNSVSINDSRQNLDWSAWHAGIASGKSGSINSHLLRMVLWLASLPYGASVRLRNSFFAIKIFRTKKVDVPVVCIGNLTAGGTGKTPCVEWVCKFLCSLGLRVAILSRGYGGAGGANDEAMVLEDRLPDVPHLQGADRYLIAQSAIEELESEVLVLDDGFQHRQLARDLDIVLVDATNPWGHGYLLPRGTLREPSAGLKRAGAVVITRADQVAEEKLACLRIEICKLAPNSILCEAIHQPVEMICWGSESMELEEIKGRKVLAFCGIGNPGSFIKTLENLGASVIGRRVFPDHYAYARKDIQDLIEWATQFADCDILLVTTHKDLVKIRTSSLGGNRLYALRVEMSFLSGEEQLQTLVRSKTLLV